MGFLLDGGWECGPVGLGLGWHWRAVGLSMMETQLKHGDNHWVLAHLLELICPVWELPAKLLSLPLPAPPVTQTRLEHFCSWRLTTSWDSPCPGGWGGLGGTLSRCRQSLDGGPEEQRAAQASWGVSGPFPPYSQRSPVEVNHEGKFSPPQAGLA